MSLDIDKIREQTQQAEERKRPLTGQELEDWLLEKHLGLLEKEIQKNSRDGYRSASITYSIGKDTIWFDQEDRPGEFPNSNTLSAALFWGWTVDKHCRLRNVYYTDEAHLSKLGKRFVRTLRDKGFTVRLCQGDYFFLSVGW